MIIHRDVVSRHASTRPSRQTHPAHIRLNIPAAMLAVALIVAGCGRGTTSPDGPTAATTARADEADVAAVVTAWDAAWNAGDAAGLAATFVDDAEFINAMGQLFVGADQIRAQHAITLAGKFKGSHTEGHIRRITFLNGTAAVVDVDNNLTRYEPVTPGSTILSAIDQSGRHKRLVVKRGGVWRAQLFQNTTVVPTP